MVTDPDDEPAMSPVRFGGPLFEELGKGQIFHSPSITLTDGLGPVHEGDTLSSDLMIGPGTRLDGGGTALELRSLVRAHRPEGDVDVLDWAYTVLMPS